MIQPPSLYNPDPVMRLKNFFVTQILEAVIKMTEDEQKSQTHENEKHSDQSSNPDYTGSVGDGSMDCSW